MGYVLELESQARALADAVSARVGRDPETWWMARLIQQSLSDQPQTISRSPFGFLLSIDTERPDLIRSVAQPGNRLTAAALEAILEGAGDAGHDAATIVRSLGEGDASFRGDWQIAFGEGEQDARLYAGPRGAKPLTASIPSLRNLGLWPPCLDDTAAELLSRLRPSVVLSGVGRRFGDAASYKIYTYSVIPLRPELVEYVAFDLPSVVQGDLQRFLGSVESLADSPHPHTWSLSLDSEGALLDWKLELTYHQLGVDRLLRAWPELDPFIQWVRETADRVGVVSRASGVSFRARHNGGSVVVYMAFEPHGFAFS